MADDPVSQLDASGRHAFASAYSLAATEGADAVEVRHLLQALVDAGTPGSVDAHAAIGPVAGVEPSAAAPAHGSPSLEVAPTLEALLRSAASRSDVVSAERLVEELMRTQG